MLIIGFIVFFGLGILIVIKYKEKLEWIEIEESGTKYIIRVEERKINKDKQNLNKNHVVAKKNGIIISVDAKSGEIVKNKNDYVKKGDIIISGNITLNENIKNQTNADGTIYAETWYTTNVTFPYHYKKINLTNNKKTVFVNFSLQMRAKQGYLKLLHLR